MKHKDIIDELLLRELSKLDEILEVLEDLKILRYRPKVFYRKTTLGGSSKMILPGKKRKRS